MDSQVSLVDFGLWMKKQAYRHATIVSTIACLKSVARHAGLDDPEQCKEYVGLAQVSEGRKLVLVEALARYYKYRSIPFDKPNYVKVLRLPFIPLEREVDELISACNRRTGAFARLIKETGVRPGEAYALRWIDVDSERSSITVLPEKNSNSRQLKISSQLISMLNMLPRPGEFVFHKDGVEPYYSLQKFRRTFTKQRNKLADRLQNPRLKEITFKTLRHFKATMEYHKTKDILHVMQLLGHKNIRNTLVYTHLVNFESDEWVCKVAKNVDQARNLLESGFDYVCEVEGYKMFRKRK